MNPYPPKTPFSYVKSSVFVAFAVIAVTFGGFGGWAAYAPLASAAVGTGAVGVSSRRQTIQHLEGGIIEEIRVKDGDRVKAGDLLIRLDETKPGSLYRIARSQYLAALGDRARLAAERDGQNQIAWPKDLQSSDRNPSM